MRATVVKDNLPGYRGYASLYKLEPPMFTADIAIHKTDIGQVNSCEFDYVVLSSTVDIHGDVETTMFLSDKDAGIRSPMGVACMGIWSHQRLLAHYNYEVGK